MYSIVITDKNNEKISECNFKDFETAERVFMTYFEHEKKSNNVIEIVKQEGFDCFSTDDMFLYALRYSDDEVIPIENSKPMTNLEAIQQIENLIYYYRPVGKSAEALVKAINVLRKQVEDECL